MASATPPKPLSQSFPTRLKEARLAKSWLPEDLAEAAGKSPRTIRNLESGTQLNPNEHTRISIATALNVSYDWLWHNELEPTPQAQAQSKPRTRSWQKIAIPVLISILTTFFIVFIVPLKNAKTASELTIKNGNLTAINTSTNKPMWTFDRDANVQFFQETPWNDDTVLVGLTASADDGGRLHLLKQSNGSVIWTHTLNIDQVSTAFGAEAVESAGFLCNKIHFPDFDGDGEREIVAEFMHGRWYPHSLVHLTRDGRKLHQYDHRGRLYDSLIVDLDRDGREEILFTATNNAPCYQTGSLLKLDHQCMSGASLDLLAGDTSALPDSAAIRLVFASFGNEFLECVDQPRMHARNI